MVAHALIDALLGGANLGDISAMFPSDDDELAGISSLLLLSRATGGCTTRGMNWSTRTAS